MYLFIDRVAKHEVVVREGEFQKGDDFISVKLCLNQHIFIDFQIGINYMQGETSQLGLIFASNSATFAPLF